MTDPQASENRHPAEKKEKKKKPVRKIFLAAILASVVIIAGIFGLQTTTDCMEWLPFGNSRSPAGQSDDAEEQQAEAVRLTDPQIIAAGDGSGFYYCVSSDYKLPVTAETEGIYTINRMLLAAVKDYLSKGSEAETITLEEFQRASETGTLSAQYSCSIPFDDFADHNHLKQPDGSTVHFFSRLILSAENDGTLYLYDGKNKQYYRVKKERNGSGILTGNFIVGLVKTVSDNAQQIRYANSGFWSGEGELLPQSVAASEENSADPVPRAQEFSPEYSSTDSEDLKKLEALFFPEGMDFVQKIKTSDESLIYIYGSMEKMLRVSHGGGFTYTQENETHTFPDQLNIFQSQGFYESLALAVQYIKTHGGWPSEISDDINVRLISVEKIKRNGDSLFPKEEKGYRFTFALEMGGFILSYQEGVPLSIDVYGKKTTAFHRDLPDLSALGKSGENSQNPSEPLEAEAIPQDSTSSGFFSRNDSGENALSSAGEKSAFFTEGGNALNLRTVIQINSMVLSDALNEEETGQEEWMQNNVGESADTEDILQRITAADLRLFRMDTARNNTGSPTEPSGSSSTGNAAEENTENTPSSELSVNNGSEAAFTDHSSGNWLLTPAWRIRAGNRIFWFHALTGALLQG